MATIRDIASKCNVSVATVSRVLNPEKAPQVRPQLRQHILDVIKEENYRPNLCARHLSKTDRKTVGMLLPSDTAVFASEYYMRLAKGAAEELAERGFNLMALLPTAESFACGSAEISSSGLVRGMILLGALYDEHHLASLRQLAIPCVLISDFIEDANCCAVDCDNHAGAAQATTHLISLGHKRISMICGSSRSLNSRQRLAGFTATLKAHALELFPEMIKNTDFAAPETSGYAAARELLQLPPEQRPTAIFAASDGLAIGALNALRDAGIAVPGEMSVVGFDDFSIARVSVPQLTTVRQPLEEMGREAARLILELSSEGKKYAQGVSNRIFPTELVIRASSGSAPFAAPG